MILENNRRTTDELVDLPGVSWSSCPQILSEELQIKKFAAKSGERWLHHDNAPAHNF
jgi:hypothetical protein